MAVSKMPRGWTAEAKAEARRARDLAAFQKGRLAWVDRLAQCEDVRAAHSATAEFLWDCDATDILSTATLDTLKSAHKQLDLYLETHSYDLRFIESLIEAQVLVSKRRVLAAAGFVRKRLTDNLEKAGFPLWAMAFNSGRYVDLAEWIPESLADASGQ